MTNRLLDLENLELQEWFNAQGVPAYRVKQVEDWVFRSRIEGFDEMTNIPKKLRESLAGQFGLFHDQVVRRQAATDGTEKLLLALAGGGRIECVLLRDGVRRSICVSSQVGCAMGCVFCASGLDGVERNLTRGEILEQALLLQRRLPAEERLSHVVMMGMGEPLANLDHVLGALEVICSPRGLGISARRITISTVGLPAAIRRLTQRESRYHLAVSLHAPNDELRNQLVPVNRQTGLDEILAAADEYFERSGRRLTYEYVLLGGLNDAPEHAQQLARLLRGRTALLNVIPYNPVAGLPYETPSRAAQQRFQEILERANINVQFRQRKGDEIQAACGQLRRDTASNSNPLVALEPHSTAEQFVSEELGQENLGTLETSRRENTTPGSEPSHGPASELGNGDSL